MCINTRIACRICVWIATRIACQILKLTKQMMITSLKKYKRGAIQKLFSETDMEQWNLVKLKDVVKVFDGTHQTPNYKTTGVRFISVENILDPLATQKYISEDDYRKEFKVHPEYGDVLMTRIGDIGRTYYVNFDSDMAYYVSLALFKCSPKIEGRFLAAYISTNTFQKELWERTLHIAFPKKINTGEIGECSINKTVQRIYDKKKGESYLHIGPPKTKTSARTIPVPSLLMNIIKKFYTENPNHYFLTGKTKPTEPRTYRQFFSRFLKRNGLQKVKFHEIRHTFAVRAIEIPEFDIKSLSEILGHKNVSFTLNVYGSANLQQKVKCMNLLNDLL